MSGDAGGRGRDVSRGQVPALCSTFLPEHILCCTQIQSQKCGEDAQGDPRAQFASTELPAPLIRNGQSVEANWADYFLVELYNVVGHGLLSPFECLCSNFILPETGKPCLLFCLLQFAQLIVPYPSGEMLGGWLLSAYTLPCFNSDVRLLSAYEMKLLCTTS